VVLERVDRPIAIERHLALESGVAPLQLEVLFDDAGKRKTSIKRHADLPLQRQRRAIVTHSAASVLGAYSACQTAL
jgi:hypothetical protein